MIINSPFIFFFILFLFVLIKSQQYINIIITEETDTNHIKTVGQNGFFYMVTDTKNLSMFNQSEIEEQTKFEGVFENDDYGYITVPNCSLWSPENMNIVVICPFTSDFISSEKYRLIDGKIKFEDYSIFIWSSYYFNFDVKEFNIPFIYSLPQSIILDEAETYYELKFKIKSYRGESLALISKNQKYSFALKDYSNYLVNENELILGFEREKINEVMFNNALGLAFLNKDLGIFNFELVEDIQINYAKDRQNIYLGLTETLNKVSGKDYLNPTKVILPNENEIIIRIEPEDNKNIIQLGQKGTLYFFTNYNDTDDLFNPIDIEENTKFNSTIIDDEKNSYNVNCRLWEPTNEKLIILCNLEENLKLGYQNVTLTDITFNYGKYNISILSETSIIVQQLNYPIPFIYSDKQNINMNDDTDIYEFKFKYDKYNTNDILYFHGAQYDYTILENCETNNTELICCLSREKLMEVLTYNNEVFMLGLIDDNLGTAKFNLVYDINVNYEITEKENITITITKLLNSATEIGSPFAYEANLNADLNQNLNTYLFNFKFNKINNGYCYFKKNNNNKNNNIFLLCNIIGTKETYTLGKIEQEIYLDDIHYKYNFIIHPVENNEIISIKDFGTSVGLVYPEVLNLTSEKAVTIRYIMPYPSYSKNIKLNPESDSYLECQDKPGLKICSVPLRHFISKETDYYNTYHLNHMNEYWIYYEVNPINVILPPIIEIKIEDKYNEEEINLGIKGTLYFETSYNDTERNLFNIDDIEERTLFETNITVEENNIYKILCRLWKPLNDNLRLFCEINDTLSFGHLNITNIESSVLQYNENKIVINYYGNKIKVNQINSPLPFLYSEKQTIDIIKEKDNYELKFKIGKYDEEILFFYDSLFNSIILDQCDIKEKILTCQIQKGKIEKILFHNIEDLFFGSHNKYIGIFRFANILGITINYHDIQKENIDVYITKLMNNYYKVNNFIAYETNVNFISSVSSSIFPFEIGGELSNCMLKKEERKNLLFLCQAIREGNYSLGEIKEDILLDEINIKYNFIIKQVTNEEVFTVDGYGGYFSVTYPLELDFTIKDNLIVEYYGINPERSEGIKLNPDAEELKCENEKELKRCYVPLTHFERKASGYHYSYRSDPLDKTTINYESPRIKVILPNDNEYKIRIKPEDNKNGIQAGLNGTMYLFSDYNEKEKNIFDPSDIEEKTEFNTTIFDDQKNIYNVNCRLWKPTNEKLIIFCNLQEKLINAYQSLTLTNSRLTYHEYNITIISETSIIVEQLNYPIPFIYSDKQSIIINDDIDIYELKFKFDKYNGDILYLQGNSYRNSYAILDVCETNYEKELICRITKAKLEEVLEYTKEIFKLGTMNDYRGLFKFNLVPDINVNYEITEKENITVTITNLLNNVTESSSGIAYNTNIDSINNLHTRYFSMKFTHSGESQYCYFKKNEIKNLLLICIMLGEGKSHPEKKEQEIYLDYIHYKYNFIIQPFENNDIITIAKSGTLIDLVYPEVLNFTAEESLTIRYIMTFPYFSTNIKLNPDSDSYLECKDLNGMKKCTVPISHFRNKKTCNYSTYHLNHLNEYSIYYDANPINVILPYWKIDIGIEDKDNQNTINIGQKGVLYFVTNYKDTENIFEEEYSFKGDFIESIGNKIYNTDCILWKPKDENMRIICQLNENMEKDEQIFYMINTSFIYKEKYNITINYKAVNINVKQLKSLVSFLYYSKQEIEIKDNVDNYQLVFKQYKYDNRPLYLYKNDIKSILLYNCKSENKQITCNIGKNKLLEILSYSSENYYLAEKMETEGLYIFNSVLNISFNYNIEQKNINIKIGKLLTPYIYKNEFIAYEVNTENNVTNSIITDYFDIGTEQNSKMKCIFKKSYNHNNLFLLCNATNAGKNSLGIINSASKDNINIFYKFSIEQSENYDEFFVSNKKGTKITSLSPLLLNFTEKDNYSIIYETEYPEKLDGIKLNNISLFDLECIDKPCYKECIINKTHFTKSGFYYTLHSNHKGTKTVSYEAPMINVILKEETPTPKPSDDTNYGLIIGISIAAVIIIILIIFFVWKYLQHKKNKGEDSKKEKLVSVNDIMVSSQVKEGINQSVANEE